MPIYEYHCEKCGELFEMILRVSDAQPKRCRKCGGKLVKQISNTTFILKGSGWYATDYGKKSINGSKPVTNHSRSGGNGASAAGSSDAGEDTGAGKSEEGEKESPKKSPVTPAE